MIPSCSYQYLNGTKQNFTTIPNRLDLNLNTTVSFFDIQLFPTLLPSLNRDSSLIHHDAIEYYQCCWQIFILVSLHFLIRFLHHINLLRKDIGVNESKIGLSKQAPILTSTYEFRLTGDKTGSMPINMVVKEERKQPLLSLNLQYSTIPLHLEKYNAIIDPPKLITALHSKVSRPHFSVAPLPSASLV